jgi:hypothetical protein
MRPWWSETHGAASTTLLRGLRPDAHRAGGAGERLVLTGIGAKDLYGDGHDS